MAGHPPVGRLPLGAVRDPVVGQRAGPYIYEYHLTIPPIEAPRNRPTAPNGSPPVWAVTRPHLTGYPRSGMPMRTTHPPVRYQRVGFRCSKIEPGARFGTLEFCPGQLPTGLDLATELKQPEGRPILLSLPPAAYGHDALARVMCFKHD